MSINFNSTKVGKKKVSRFQQQVQKPQLKKLIARLSESFEASQSQLVSQILQNRSRKISEMRKMRPKYIWQNSMVPTSSIEHFSEQKPISSGEKFLAQKVRANLLTPQRAFNPQPNIKAGSVDVTRITNFHSNENEKVISKKFEEFVRIIEEQSGSLKRKRMSDVTNETSLPTIKSPYKVTMKKTYFKKFTSDQYNFYKPPIKDITRKQKIFELTTQRQSTERSMSGEFEMSRQISPNGYRTLQINISRQSSQRNLNDSHAKILDSYKSDRPM